MSNSLPRVAQTLDFSCGPACFESMFQFLKKESKGEMYFAQQLGTIVLGYTPPEAIHKLALEYGFSSRFKRDATWVDIVKAVNENEIVFVTWWDEDAGHYSLVKQINDSQVILMDPWQARSNQDTYIAATEFQVHWAIRGRIMIAIQPPNAELSNS